MIDWGPAKALAAGGATGSEIAKHLGCTASAVHYWARREGVRLSEAITEWRWRPIAVWREEHGSQVIGRGLRAGRVAMDAQLVKREGAQWRYLADTGTWTVAAEVTHFMPLPPVWELGVRQQ